MRIENTIHRLEVAFPGFDADPGFFLLNRVVCFQGHAGRDSEVPGEGNGT
jgi:hypothetical protein